MAAAAGQGSALRPPVVLLAVSIVALVLVAAAGYRAWKVDSARQLELRRAQSALASFGALRRQYVPAVAAESIAWRRTWLQLQELGVGSDQPIALTQRVARTAEAVGLSSVRVLIDPPDTLGQQRVSTGGVQSKPASYSLRVECRGGLASVLAFLDQLPPSVAPTALSLVRQDGRGTHRISLAVYELTLTNDAPADWSSNERSSAGAGRGSRPGG